MRGSRRIVRRTVWASRGRSQTASAWRSGRAGGWPRCTSTTTSARGAAGAARSTSGCWPTWRRTRSTACWSMHLDRLHRQPSELEAFIDLCQRLGLTNVASVSGDIDLTTAEGQFQARILGGVAKNESDHKSARIRRKHEEIAAEGRVSGGGSRPYGYEPDKVTIRPAEAAVVAECAQRLLGGGAGALDRTGFERRERSRPRPAASGRRRACAGCWPRPGSAGQREHRRRDRGDRRVAGDHQRGRRSARSAPCWRTRSGAPTRQPAATCWAACSSAATAGNAWWPARARVGSAATPAPRASAFPGAARRTSTRTRSSSFVTEAVLHRSTRATCSGRWSGGSSSAPEAERWWKEAEAAKRAARGARRRVRAARDHDWTSGRQPASRSSSG